jgi:hypothetical protein
MGFRPPSNLFFSSTKNNSNNINNNFTKKISLERAIATVNSAVIKFSVERATAAAIAEIAVVVATANTFSPRKFL